MFDDDYKSIVVNYLLMYRDRVKLSYQEFQYLEKIIDFFYNDESIEDIDFDLQIETSITNGESIYSLDIYDSYYKFTEILRDGSDHHTNISIELNYENSNAIHSDGYIGDWEERVNQLLELFDKEYEDTKIDISVFIEDLN